MTYNSQLVRVDTASIASIASTDTMRKVEGLVPLKEFKAQAAITPLLDSICSNIENSPASIVNADTGVGKSTLVPIHLLEQGYNVVVTQPRILAARSLATFTSQLIGCPLGGLIGYETAMEKACGLETKLRYCTDGLTKVRELAGRGGNRNILIIDEVHEWNSNIELLVAWVKRELQQGANFKCVLMSATLEAEKLSEFFEKAPIAKVVGKVHPLSELPRGQSIFDDTVRLAGQGHNVLVFLPGKPEIGEMQERLRLLQVNAEVFELHGELAAEKQALCFRDYPRPKIILATNIAQTSVSVPGINAVIISGLERRIEVRDAIEGLYVGHISQADCIQQSGRANRFGSGVFIDHHPLAWDERSPFSTPEILRKRLDQEVLKLAKAGLDMQALEFFHQPPLENVNRAKRTAIYLGCMTDSGKVTNLGNKISELPVSVKVGRMIAEATERGVLDDVLTIAAIIEAGGIISRDALKGHSGNWRALFCKNEQSSDLLAQLAVFNGASKMSKEEAVEAGVFWKSFKKTQEIRRHLLKALKLREEDLVSSGDRDEIKKSIVAGMLEDVYLSDGAAFYDGKSRRTRSEGSVVYEARLVAGVPFDLQFTDRYGSLRTIHLLQFATKVDPRWLEELGPNLFKYDRGLAPRYDPSSDSIISTTERRFNGLTLDRYEERDSKHPEGSHLLAQWLARRILTRSAEPIQDLRIERVIQDNLISLRRAQELNWRAGHNACQIWSEREIEVWLLDRLNGAKCCAEIRDTELLRLPKPDELAKKVLESFPDSIRLLGRDFPITYTAYSAPYIQIKLENAADKIWREIQSYELSLPNGTPLRLLFLLPNSQIWGSSAEETKQIIARNLDSHTFHEWSRGQTGKIFEFREDQNFEIETMEYGKSAKDDSPLIAYGCFNVRSNSQLLPTWTWFETREQAVRALTQMQVDLPIVMARAREREARIADAESKARAWQKKQDEIARQIACGEAIQDFVGIDYTLARKQGFQLSDCWVIGTDGLHRPADYGDHLYMHSALGQKKWSLIMADDLAISWKCKTESMRDSNSEFGIEHMPKSGLSSAQMRAVAEIETKRLKVKAGSFNLDERGLLKRHVITDFCKNLPSCPATGKVLNWNLGDFANLSSKEGMVISADDPRIYKLFNYADKFQDWPSGGKAQLVYLDQAGPGTLELFALDLGSKAQLVVRWVPESSLS